MLWLGSQLQDARKAEHSLLKTIQEQRVALERMNDAKNQELYIKMEEHRQLVA